ncbi:MAG: single-stranded DNA-binding protein [Desulfitobacteriaceae bacterium]|nr:single-stranded DNA-binding protein [Desulfitobacteriaceae bacterium]MDI6914386.1 single-stranded DNA-binding protein [Desulfitobacteriaceae bacterium]
MLNRVVLIGRLTKDPELRYTQSGVAVATFTLAVDRKFKNAQGERETDFIPCVAYRQLAELCSNYLSKGKLAAVEGRIQVSSFTGKDGQRRWSTEVIAEDVRFLSPKDSAAAGASGSGESYSGAGSFGHEVSLDDDIPF